ncbi:hypothetical protein OJAV_G00049880 [Oryzias javanicus]|uniref:Uncharacterized protein n=1 Tax=Oryzias javanicus TaxID=123683 RepID=A0A3S2N4T7_ORYJA|nr:hypothetical protein OJAV_G00049880 [Oryzias javanicus]
MRPFGSLGPPTANLLDFLFCCDLFALPERCSVIRSGHTSLCGAAACSLHLRPRREERDSPVSSCRARREHVGGLFRSIAGGCRACFPSEPQRDRAASTPEI